MLVDFSYLDRIRGRGGGEIGGMGRGEGRRVGGVGGEKEGGRCVWGGGRGGENWCRYSGWGAGVGGLWKIWYRSVSTSVLSMCAG